MHIFGDNGQPICSSEPARVAALVFRADMMPRITPPSGWRGTASWAYGIRKTPTSGGPPNTKSVIYAALGLPPGGTPSISPIPPEALVVVDVAEAASLRLSLVALTMLAAIPVRAHS
jgi:hypothetical protein